MEKITRKDIKEINSFNKFGDNFTKVWSDDAQHIYVFKRTNKQYMSGQFEVVKGKKYTNPDMSVVWVYPSSAEFGENGYCINGARKDYKERIKMYIEKLRS